MQVYFAETIPLDSSRNGNSPSDKRAEHPLATLLDRLSFRATQRRWAKAVRELEDMDLVSLRQMRNAGRNLRSHIDQVITHAEDRLAVSAMGGDRIRSPHTSDWAWRPSVWRAGLKRPGIAGAETMAKLGDDVSVFHDCSRSELTLRQIRNHREEDLAPYGLQMDVFRFDGSFLSIVLDLPAQAMEGLNRTHIIQIDCLVDLERPIEIFARLNIKNGPNTEQIVCELPTGENRAVVEFDLAYSNLNERRVEKAWLDMIFEGPEMNQVNLRDLTMSRRVRSAL